MAVPLGIAADRMRKPLNSGIVVRTGNMLDKVDQIELSQRQRPMDGRPGEIASALKELAFAATDEAAQAAYNRMLYAVGNNHCGSYFPIVLDVVPFFGEILQYGTRLSRARTLDVLIDLVGSFGPDPDVLTQDGIRPEDLPEALRACVGVHCPTLQTLAADPSAPDVQALAKDLLDCLAD